MLLWVLKVCWPLILNVKNDSLITGLMKFLYHSYQLEPCYLPLLNISKGLAPGEVVEKEREDSHDDALAWN